MTWTNWHQPQSMQYTENDEVQYAKYTRGVLATVLPIWGVSESKGSGDPTIRFQEPTAIIFSDFGFDLAGFTVETVELELHVQRLARIQDKEIALWTGTGTLKNMANPENPDVARYILPQEPNAGEPVIPVDWDNWGVYVDLQPHQQTPSSNIAVIRSVKVRLDLV